MLMFVWPLFDHNGAILLAATIGFVAFVIMLLYLEEILETIHQSRPPVEFVFKEGERYCRRCGHEMEPAFTGGDECGIDVEWLLDYCPDCIKEWR